MSGRVIQGFFIGRMRPARNAAPGTVQRAMALPGRPGPPAPAFAARPGAVQPRSAAGRPLLAHQPAHSGGGDSFEIDPVQLGLARGGGQKLPQAVLAKMEAAFGADFSGVRVHVGSQASRIGAVAFTMGNDLYFAPGQFQPDSPKGQQLIGHELAHVIQQRQGRVRTPASGVAVVQDRALEAEADRLGMRAANHRMPVQAKPVQRAAAAGARAHIGHQHQRPVGRPGLVVQRCMEMTHTGNLDYDGDLIGRDVTHSDVVALLDDLKKNHGYNTAMLKTVSDLIEADPTFLFDNPTHLKNYVTSPTQYPPTLVHDSEGADYVDEVASQFGSAFKGPTIKFSGSRVYAVAHSEGTQSIWAMLNSATGYIGASDRNVVKTWQPSQMPIEFPSNSLKRLKSAGLTRPKVMSGNAHAEVNEILQHAVRALADIHKTPHDVGLMFGSDIQHCAECYWAAHAMWKKGGTKRFNTTGCGNKLFARWREPWNGFYAEYGDNPFRKKDGSFKTGFAMGTYTATALNSATSGSVGNIYS